MRYAMRRVAARWVPEHAVAGCMKHVRHDKWEPGYGARVVGGDNCAAIVDVQPCGSVWDCAPCAARITERRRDELKGAMKCWTNQGGRFLMITNTAPHGKRDRLAETTERLQAAREHLAGQRAYKTLVAELARKHWVRSLEDTVGERSGHHPHTHEGWFLASADDQGAAPELDEVAIQKRLAPLWLRACDAAGLTSQMPAWRRKAFLERGVKVQVGYEGMAEYLEKWGHERQWGLEDELAKGNVKKSREEYRYTPFGLLAAAVEHPNDPRMDQWRAWFREYSEVFKGRSQLRWSKGAKAALGVGEVSDEAIAGEEEPESPYTWELRTYDAEWDAVLRECLDEEMEEVAATEGKAGLVSWLVWLGDRCCDRDATVQLGDGRRRYLQPVFQAKLCKVPGWVHEPPDRGAGPPRGKDADDGDWMEF